MNIITSSPRVVNSEKSDSTFISVESLSGLLLLSFYKVTAELLVGRGFIRTDIRSSALWTGVALDIVVRGTFCDTRVDGF